MKTTVEDVMSSPVHVVSPGTWFKEMVRLIETHAVSALPVVDTDRRLVGIVSEADLLLKEQREDLAQPAGVFGARRRRAERAKAEGTTAADLMTTPAVTISPKARLVEAARLMHEKSIKRLPVVDDDGQVVGIVSRGDLLKVFQREDVDIRREIIEDVIVRTLWMDPMTIKVTVEGGLVALEGELDRRGDVPVLVRLAERVDGVVDVRQKLTYRYDDTSDQQEYANTFPAIRW